MFRLDSMHNAYEHLVGRIAATSYESAQLQPIQWLYFENNFAILFGIKYRHFSIVVNNFYSDFIWIDILTVIYAHFCNDLIESINCVYVERNNRYSKKNAWNAQGNIVVFMI